jgi:hypothetical protein
MTIGKRNQAVSGHSERGLHHLSASESDYCTLQVRLTGVLLGFRFINLGCTILVHKAIVAGRRLAMCIGDAHE